jgi:hypothetical protein
VADSLMTVDVDTAPLYHAFEVLQTELQHRINDASEVTAQAIVRDARARLERQLGPGATGQTVSGITAKRAYDGNGWVVLADNARMPNLPLWLEKGTKPGGRKNFARTPRKPFFYTSIELEVGAHERRVDEAMHDAAGAVGLGD